VARGYLKHAFSNMIDSFMLILSPLTGFFTLEIRGLLFIILRILAPAAYA
jgi:hypothetical protein